MKDRKPAPTSSTWISTHDLTAGMKVIGKGAQKVFQVVSVSNVPYGYVVTLANMMTRAESTIPIQADKAHQRIWLVRRPKGSVE